MTDKLVIGKVYDITVFAPNGGVVDKFYAGKATTKEIKEELLGTLNSPKFDFNNKNGTEMLK